MESTSGRFNIYQAGDNSIDLKYSVDTSAQVFHIYLYINEKEQQATSVCYPYTGQFSSILTGQDADCKATITVKMESGPIANEVIRYDWYWKGVWSVKVNDYWHSMKRSNLQDFFSYNV